MPDEIAPRNPVGLFDIDGHSIWVNSLAPDLAGISAETEVAAGGEIILGEDGEPSSMLFERAGDKYLGIGGLSELSGNQEWCEGIHSIGQQPWIDDGARFV